MSLELESNRPWEITGLGAWRPNPEFREKLSLFGQFVGNWDILENRFIEDDGTETVQHGELHWGWILDGRAVQDVWMYFNEETGRLVPAGTTIRFYDSAIDAWQSIWITPLGNSVMGFVGGMKGNEIVLEAKEEDGTPIRWIFFDIQPSSFKWRGEISKDLGKTWTVNETMVIRRKLA